MYPSQQRRNPAFSFAQGIPATMTLIIANVITFFLIAGLPVLRLGEWLGFATPHWPRYAWTLLTWPLVGIGHPLHLVFGIGWAYMFAGSLERSWGTRPFATFLVATAALTAFTMWLGSLLVGPGAVAGLWAATGAAVVAWSVVNSREQVNFFFLPLPAPVVGALGAAIVWYEAGPINSNPLLGLFALSGCVAAYWYAKHGRYLYRGYTRSNSGGRTVTSPAGTTLRFRNFDREPSAPRRGGFSLMRWLESRRQRRELDKLWKRSGFSDRDKTN
jgi:membrane associated rhomboid family serine protease